MTNINALVVDDEILNRDLITKLILKTNSNYNVVGDAENIEVAYKLINELKPDVVFLDIKMPGGNGFDLLRKFENPPFEVVFITGFDEYAIQAFEFNALDYILKPIDTTKLKNTLDKVFMRLGNKLATSQNLNQIASYYDAANLTITRIPIHYKDKVVLIEINDIVSIQADEGCTQFRMINSEVYISSKQLISFEFLIDPHKNFIRVNKSTFVNLKYLKTYSKGHTCLISLTNGESFEVSRRKKSEILAILDQN